MPEKSVADRPRIVCLCGSVRFAAEFRAQRERLTLDGCIVVGPEILDTGLSHDLGPIKAALDQLHLRKIDIADEILVVNVDGYYGESTAREIAYARQQGKPIRWLESVTVDAARQPTEAER